MSTTHPVIVYSGTLERTASLNALAEARGWYVFSASSMLETLGQTVMFFPDVVILEEAPDASLAHDIFEHLVSIQHEPMLILSDTPEHWDVASDALIQVLPRSSSILDIADTLLAMTAGYMPQWQ
jgi:hypothetical protein